MSLSTQDVEHLAKLSRLTLKPDEVEAYRSSLLSTLDYVDALKSIDTTGVPPLAHPTDMVNVFREDTPTQTPNTDREALLNAFPRRQGDLLEVQAVFTGRLPS